MEQLSAFDGLLMQVAARLDQAVEATCIPPCLPPPPPTPPSTTHDANGEAAAAAAAAPGSMAAAAVNASTASARQLLRAVRLFGVIGRWSLHLSSSWQELGMRLLSTHILPYLKALLDGSGGGEGAESTSALAVERALEVCLHLARSRPSAVRGERLGGGEPCTMAIKGFAESAAAAGGGAAVEERLRAIVEELKA